MALSRSIAVAQDASRIAEIHMAAFAPNAMLRAQFPSEESRKGLLHTLEKRTRDEINDMHTTILVVWAFDNQQQAVDQSAATMTVDSDAVAAAADGRKKLIAFAKWAHPMDAEDGYQEAPWNWPEGTALNVLRDWSRVTEEAQNAAVGSEPCYRLTFIATDPQFIKRGAGSSMVEWGIERCQEGNVPAYLESTMEAVPFYEKLGFESVVELSLDIGDETPSGGGAVQKYCEIGMVYRPKREVQKRSDGTKD